MFDISIQRLASSMDSVPPETIGSIQKFLFCEVALLDARRYEDWQLFLADDLHYYMPIITTRAARERDQEVIGGRSMAHYDENKRTIMVRIKRLLTNKAWSEEPASRTKHLVSNILVRSSELPDLFEVDSMVLVNRSHGERENDILVASRRDNLRQADNPLGWEIVRREILINQSTILAKHISFFL